MKTTTIPATKLALVSTALVAALLMFTDRASAVSVGNAHELGFAPSRYTDGSTYVNHLISMALRSDERANGQHFRPNNAALHAVPANHRNAWNARGRSVEVITIPSPGGVPGGGTGVPDGGLTAMLLGTALGSLGILRRYMRI
ncbi:MAG TPA: hypothetical protein VFA85_01985 [Terriglobales bacterium]|nr:hypothetical protein [Terriglobales bacterium]